MSEKFTRETIRKLVDKAKMQNTVNDNGSIVVIFTADEDFGYDVVIVFILDETADMLRIEAFAEDFSLTDEELPHAYLKCNEWNSHRNFGQAYINDNEIGISQSSYLDDSMSEDYVFDKIIKFLPQVFWLFFCELVKK